MKTEQKVTSNVEDVRWVITVDPNDEDSVVAVSDMDDNQLAAVAKRLGATPELINEINWHFEYLIETLHSDLADIWKQTERVKSAGA